MQKIPRLFSISLIACIQTISAQYIDSIHVIDSVVVKAKHPQDQSHGSLGDIMTWNIKSMDALPSILSSNNPIKTLQLLPGISSNSEYQSGLYIQGCDNSHNLISISDAPIYNAEHLLGIFSIFNANHFQNVKLTTTGHDASFANRLDSEVNFTSIDTITTKFHVSANVGLISSDLHLELPITNHVAVYLSGRLSYLNIFYGSLLNSEGMKMKYGFNDINATIVVNPNSNDHIKLDIYTGSDNFRIKDDDNSSTYNINWGNELALLSWRHIFHGGMRTEQSVYLSKCNSNVKANLAGFSGLLDANLLDISYKGNLSGSIKNIMWKIGTEHTLYDIHPQHPDLITNSSLLSAFAKRQHTYEGSTYINSAYSLKNFHINLGARASIYKYEHDIFMHFDPRIGIRYKNKNVGEFWLNAGIYHQYLHHTGFSNSGFPTEYWISASDKYNPQCAYSISLGYGLNILDGYELQLELYCKKIKNQTEYNGDIIDALLNQSLYNNPLRLGEGNNSGISLLIRKKIGFLTGWISYAYTRAKRKFQDNEIYNFDESHERPHEFSMVGVFHIKRFNISTSLLWASGTPYTPVKYSYVINDEIISEYGKYNSGRLPSYFKLDIAATYWLHRDIHYSSGWRFSIYNATVHKNILSYHVHTGKVGNVSFTTDKFFAKILPSVCYFINL